MMRKKSYKYKGVKRKSHTLKTVNRKYKKSKRLHRKYKKSKRLHRKYKKSKRLRGGTVTGTPIVSQLAADLSTVASTLMAAAAKELNQNSGVTALSEPGAAAPALSEPALAAGAGAAGAGAAPAVAAPVAAAPAVEAAPQPLTEAEMKTVGDEFTQNFAEFDGLEVTSIPDILNPEDLCNNSPFKALAQKISNKGWVKNGLKLGQWLAKKKLGNQFVEGQRAKYIKCIPFNLKTDDEQQTDITEILTQLNSPEVTNDESKGLTDRLKIIKKYYENPNTNEINENLSKTIDKFIYDNPNVNILQQNLQEGNTEWSWGALFDKIKGVFKPVEQGTGDEKQQGTGGEQQQAAANLDPVEPAANPEPVAANPEPVAANPEPVAAKPASTEALTEASTEASANPESVASTETVAEAEANPEPVAAANSTPVEPEAPEPEAPEPVAPEPANTTAPAPEPAPAP